MRMKVAVWLLVSALAGFLPVRAAEPLDQLALNAAVSLVDEQLESVLKTLEALAGTSDVRSLDWKVIQPILQRFQQGLEGAAWFALADGTYYTAEKGLQEQKLGDRPYFPRLLDGERVVGDLVTSRSTGRPVVIAAVPVVHGGKMLGALGASLYLDALGARTYESLGLPEDITFAAVNGEGVVALHRDPAALMTKRAVPEDNAGPASELTGWRFIVVGGN